MPKVNVDYSNTIIYKIVCNNLSITDCYVGHTTSFTKRKTKHKYSCNTPEHHTYKYAVYEFIRNNGGWTNWSMIEVEKYACVDGNEARARERHWIELLKSTLNMVIPNRTNAEYYQDNKEHLKALSKIDYKTNHEEKLTKFKIYRQNNQENIKAYREANRDILNAKQREHRKDPEVKEKIKERMSKYAKENREAINQRRRERRAEKKAQSSQQTT